jgi:SAM-dependent MidA family methyltransferase
VETVDGQSRIEQVITESGPLTVAAFMDLALYDSDIGYYARAARRTGRAGDFFTSVDVGPLFGELLAAQLAEMAGLLSRGQQRGDGAQQTGPGFDLVEAGAANGRLTADILRSLQGNHPELYSRTRPCLVERSASARAAHPNTLTDFADRTIISSDRVPPFDGVLVANELLDALPVHQVVMRREGLREVFVDLDPDGGTTRLRMVEAAPSTPSLEDYLTRLGIDLEIGWRVEINLDAVTWIRQAASRLGRGFLLLFDYGHEASELYSVTHSTGTLTSYSRHQAAGPELAGQQPAWLQQPGRQDLTAHVDFTSVRRAAEHEGCRTLAFMDQTYFLMGVLAKFGSIDRLGPKDRLALKTLMMPGGLGSTMKVLVLGKGVGAPDLACCSAGMRIT